ncbi:hypothetical protein GCM10008907_04650 [Clostridium sartagoforme]
MPLDIIEALIISEIAKQKIEIGNNFSFDIIYPPKINFFKSLLVKTLYQDYIPLFVLYVNNTISLWLI